MALGGKPIHYPKPYSYYPSNRYYIPKCDIEPLTPNFSPPSCKCLCGKHSNTITRNKFGQDYVDRDAYGLGGGTLSASSPGYYQKRLFGAGNGMKNTGNGLSTSGNNIGYKNISGDHHNMTNVPFFMKNKSLPNYVHDSYQRPEKNCCKPSYVKKRPKEEQVCEHCCVNTTSPPDSDYLACKNNWYQPKNNSCCRDYGVFNRPQSAWEPRSHDYYSHNIPEPYAYDDMYTPSTRPNYYLPYDAAIIGENTGNNKLSSFRDLDRNNCGNLYCRHCSESPPPPERCDNFRCPRNKPKNSGVFYGGCGNPSYYPSRNDDHKNFHFGNYNLRATPNYYNHYSYPRGHLGREESGKNMSWSKNWYDEEDTEGIVEVWKQPVDQKEADQNTDPTAWSNSYSSKNKLHRNNSDVLIKSVENLIRSSNFTEKKPTPVQSSVEFPFNKTVPRINCDLSSFTDEPVVAKPTYLQPEKKKSNGFSKSQRKKDSAQL